MLRYWIKAFFAALGHIFQANCVVCGLPDNKAEMQSIRSNSGWAFHQKCMDEVIATPEKFGTTVLSKCAAILDGLAQMNDKRTLAIVELQIYNESLKFRKEFNARMVAARAKAAQELKEKK
jgi:hypothetical protein